VKREPCAFTLTSRIVNLLVDAANYVPQQHFFFLVDAFSKHSLAPPVTVGPSALIFGEAQTQKRNAPSRAKIVANLRQYGRKFNPQIDHYR
jgi:hypothetical protein